MDVGSFLQPTGASTPSKTPSKNRSLSDPPAAAIALAPSPNFREDTRRESKDDNAVPTTPKPLRRPDFLNRGLSLQMPSPARTITAANAAPLSPQLDQANIYSFMNSQSQTGSPATSLPRHSRGLDFSRACTNLHHSTVAERQEPDSSPVLTHKGMNIPSRKMSISSMALDSPALVPTSTWGSLAPERSTVSSSVGSVNMLGSDDDSSESDEDASMAGDDNEDAMFTTPQVHKLQNPSAPTPFAPSFTAAGAWGGGTASSPAAQSLMKTIRRSRLQNKSGRKSRKNSSSASNSGYSSMASPRAGSPPPIRSIESGAGGGYMPWSKAAQTRRESLAMGTEGMHLSSGNDSGDEASGTAPSTPGVVRRAVTRRGNLLPKTKGFARIRAALQEESAPVDTEIRRESETIRQVRERDNSIVSDFDLTDPTRPQTATAASSPHLLPAVPESDQEAFGRDLDTDLNSTNTGKGLGMNFNLHAHRNGAGMDYWHRNDASMRTPPPPNFARQGSSVMSDINMDSPGQASEFGNFPRMRARARSSASDASDAFGPSLANGSNVATAGAASSGMNDDMHLKKFKRRREDDFDIATIKRRAVSPGMSSQNSPILAQSPQYRDTNGVWGQPPERKKDSVPNSAGGDVGLQQSRSGSTGSNASAVNGGSGMLASQGKKLGLQGMTDTNDGLMSLSID